MGFPKRAALKGQTRGVAMANVHWSVTVRKLRAMVNAMQCGTVSAVQILMDKRSGFPTGKAMVTMETESAATKVIEGLEGKEWPEGANGKGLKLRTAWAEKEVRSKEEKKKEGKLKRVMVKSKKQKKMEQRIRRAKKKKEKRIKQKILKEQKAERRKKGVGRKFY